MLAGWRRPHIEKVLSVTDEHPLYLEGRGWTEAGVVSVGYAVRDRDGNPLRVVSVEADTTPTRVHNLEVAGAHTYFAGKLEAWGHNVRVPGNPVCGCKGSHYVPVAVKRWFLNNDKVSSAIKGFMRQQINSGVPMSKVKLPPGMDWGHDPQSPFCKGGRHGAGTGVENAADNRSRGGKFGR